MPFLPLYLEQLGAHRRRRNLALGRSEPWRDAGHHGVHGAVVGTPRRPLRPQDHDRAVAGQLRRRDGRHGVRHRAPGTCSRFAPCRDCSPDTARWHLTMAADSAPKEQTAYAIGFVQTRAAARPGARPGHRRRRRAGGRAAARVLRHVRASTPLRADSRRGRLRRTVGREAGRRRGQRRRSASASGTCSRSRTSSC